MPKYTVAALLAVLAVALLASAVDARGKPPPTVVTAVYFVPRDQEATMTAPEVDIIMADVRSWYDVQVGSTFAVSAAQVVRGKHDTAYYQDVWVSVLTELGYWCGTGVHVIVVHLSIAFTGGGACSDGEGTAMIAEGLWSPFEGVVAHELGHAFALGHSTCESVMWCWWDYPNVGLMDYEIETLLGSRYFRGSDEICIPKYNPHGKLVGRCS